MEAYKFVMQFFDGDDKLVAEEDVRIQDTTYEGARTEAEEQAALMLEDFDAVYFNIS